MQAFAPVLECPIKGEVLVAIGAHAFVAGTGTVMADGGCATAGIALTGIAGRSIEKLGDHVKDMVFNARRGGAPLAQRVEVARETEQDRKRVKGVLGRAEETVKGWCHDGACWGRWIGVGCGCGCKLC